MAKRPVGNQGDVSGLILPGGSLEGATGGDSNDSGFRSGLPDGLLIADPADIGSGSGDNGSDGNSAGSSGTRKRRGRAPGSTVGKRKAQALDINGVEAILFSAHAMLAGITKATELALDKDEASALAKSIASVSAHYDVTATEKTLAWTSLLMTCGMIYGPRIVAISARRAKAPRAAPAQNAPAQRGGNVVNIPGVGAVDMDALQ